MTKTATLHVHHCSPCIITTRNDQILSLIGNVDGKAINCAISVRTRVRSLLFSSNPNSLLTNWVSWNDREKKWKDAKSIFQRRFHGLRRCRIVRSLILTLGDLKSSGITSVTSVLICHLRVSRNKITETGVIHVQLGTRLTQGTQRVQKTCQTVKQKANH